MVTEMLFTDAFWYYAPILATLTVTIAGAINGKFNITQGFWPQLVAWITGSVLTVGGYFNHLYWRTSMVGTRLPLRCSRIEQ